MVAHATLSTSPPSRELRTLLIISSTIGVILNIVMTAMDRKKIEGALGIAFLIFSGLHSIFQLTNTKRRPFLNIFMDTLFTIGLFILYILVLILSSALRRHIVGVYANMMCLMSSLLHCYALIKEVYHVIEKRLLSGGDFCPHCSARPAEYKSAPMVRGTGRHGDDNPFDDDPLADDDERTPLYRDSEERGVMDV